MSHETMDPLIEGYLDYLRDVRRQKPRTITDVRCTLRRALRAMSRLQPRTPLWKLGLRDYLKWIESERQEGRSPSCLNKYLSHLRGLLDYAWRSGRSDRNVLDGFNLQDAKQRKAPRVLTVEEARSIIKASPGGSFTERRNRVILLLLYGCGLRTGELCDLNVPDVDRERGELIVHKGKGDTQRVIPIPEGVQPELWAYLLDRGGKRGPLFRTEHEKTRIRLSDVCRIVREAALRAGIQWKVTPRTLRHSYATHLMDRGVDLAVISSLMGHRSPTETGVYLHVLPGRPKQAVDKLVEREGKERTE
jgi:integrase/recombinase XerD